MMRNNKLNIIGAIGVFFIILIVYLTLQETRIKDYPKGYFFTVTEITIPGDPALPARIHTKEGVRFLLPAAYVLETKLTPGETVQRPNCADVPERIAMDVVSRQQLQNYGSEETIYHYRFRPSDRTHLACWGDQGVYSTKLLSLGTELLFVPEYGSLGEFSGWKPAPGD